MFSIVLMASGPLGEQTWFLGVLLASGVIWHGDDIWNIGMNT